MSTETRKRPMASRYRSDLPIPYLDRSVSLRFRGDWGRANFHRALGWLSYQMTVLGGPHTSVGIFSGLGFIDNIRAVGRGEVDVAITTPAAIGRMAMEGVGPFAGESFPHLRTLGVLPQNDRLLFAVRKDTGITSLADLRAKKPALRIATGYDNTDDFIGLAAHLLLRESGITPDDVAAWGGSFVYSDNPWHCLSDFAEGKADAVIYEAIMTPWWRSVAETMDLNYLPIEPAVRDRMQQAYGWPSRTLPAGYHPGLTQEVEFLDFSDFLILTTSDLPTDIGYALAWSIVESFDVLESQYTHLPPDRSSLTYPLDPKAACRSNIPLHSGAEAYYRAAGHLL